MHNKFSTTYSYLPLNVWVWSLLLIFTSFAYAQGMHFDHSICKIFLHHAMRYELDNKILKRVGGRLMKITLLMPTLVIFLYHDVFNITRPNWHGIYSQFSVKLFVPKYTLYVRHVGHWRRHSNVTNIWSEEAMKWIIFLFLNCPYFNPNCLY